MKRMNVLYLLVLLCPLSAAGLENNEIIEQSKARPEVVNVPEQPQPCPSDVHAVLREMSAKLAKHEERIEQLQKLNQEQAVKLKEVDTLKLQQLEQTVKLKEVDSMKLQQLEQSAKVDTLTVQQQEQATKLKEVDTLKLLQEGQAEELNRLKTQISVTEDHVDSLRGDRTVGQVAFSASLLASGTETIGPFNTHTTLIFRHVISNIGNAYSPDTGFFTAPVRGVYHFVLFIYGPLDNSHGSGAWLVKNGSNTCLAYEHQASGYGKSSIGVSLLLDVGDVVFPRQYANTRIIDNGNHHTMFSGHLLFLM